MHGLITTVIIEPFLQFPSALGRIGGTQTEGPRCSVPHGAVPLVITLHPSEIGIVTGLGTEEPAIGTSAISGHRGYAIRHGHLLLATVGIGQKPGEMGGILILGQRSIQVSPGIYLMSEHITDVLGRATRTAILVEDGWKILVLTIIDHWRQLYLSLTSLGTSLSPGSIFGRRCLRQLVEVEVRKYLPVHLHLSTIVQGDHLHLCT